MQRRPDRFFVDVSRSTASIMQRTINSYAVLRPLDRQEFQWIRDPRVPGSRTNSILEGGGQRGWVVEGSFFSLFPFFLFSCLSLSFSFEWRKRPYKRRILDKNGQKRCILFLSSWRVHFGRNEHRVQHCLSAYATTTSYVPPPPPDSACLSSRRLRKCTRGELLS